MKERAVERVLLWTQNHKLRVLSLVMMLMMLWPQPVRSQFLDPCCAIIAAGLATISKTLATIVGGGLNQILSVDRTTANFERNVIWPTSSINQAQGVVASLGGTYTQVGRVTSQPVASATLPATQQLEQNLLSAKVRTSQRRAQTMWAFTVWCHRVRNPPLRSKTRWTWVTRWPRTR
jgi:hypothetical protein